MRGLVRIWRLFARRSGKNWRLLGVLALGMLMAASLLAAAPIYARTMADLGLTFTVRDQLSVSPGNSAQFRAIPLATEEGLRQKQAIADRIQQRLGWFAGSESRYLRTGRFFAGVNGAATTERSPHGQIQSLVGYEEHVRLIEGAFPQDAPHGQPIEVAMSPAGAQAAQVKVGDSITFKEDFDDCAREIPRMDAPPPPPCNPKVGIAYTFSAKVTAIVEPILEDDPFWVTITNTYFAPFALGPEWGVVVPMLTTEASILENFAVDHPGYMAETGWHTYADPERLSRANFERAEEDLKALYTDLEPLGGSSFSPLTDVLNSYRDSESYQQAPLTILLLEVSAVALFYVILIALVIVERQSDEIALLRSRGATTFQVGAMYLLEGLILGIPCLLAAPLLAAAATSLLGLTPTFEKVNGGELLPTTIPISAYGYAAAGVGLSILVLLLPAVVVAGRSAVVRRREQARPGVSFLQRYYLDVALAGVAGLLLFELHERGTVFEPSPTGGVTSDPLLLASPAVLMLAAAALILRFYPMGLRLAARIFASRTTPAVAVGLWQVARSPGNSARLALLLMMAVAVGTFAASYSATAKQTYDERARYEAGVEWRMSVTGSTDLGLNGPAVDELLSTLPGVESASGVLRTTAVPAVTGNTGRSFQVLGVDPDVVAETLYFRDDFAGEDLRELMADLGIPEPLKGKQLPPGTSAISIQVSSSDPRAVQTLWARVVDRDQTFQMVELGMFEGDGWHELTAQLNRNTENELGEPLVLMSLILTEPSNRFNPQNLTILLDDLTAISGTGERTLIDGFESSAAGWAPLPTRLSKPDTFEFATEGALTGRGAGKITRAAGQSSDVWGLYTTQPALPLAAVASESFSASTGIPEGGSGLISIGDVLVPIRVESTFKLMSTLDTSAGPAIMLNRDQLLSWVGTADLLLPPGINEAWFELEPGADKPALETAAGVPPYRLDAAFDRERELERLERNPLIAAGGAGILFLAFGAVLLLVGAALLVSLWVSVQRRRGEFAVLRAMGLSRGGVVQLLAFEYALVALLGLIAGAYLGRMVGNRMLSFLNVDDQGERAEPSFLLQTEWLLVGAGGAIVLVVFALALVFAGRLISRTSDAQALRTE